jgi:hypothetical protein
MEEDKARTTHHAQDRTRDRLGISKKLADKKAQEALDYGIMHSETKGQLNRYITRLFFYNQTANNIHVYNRYIYIFADNLCITILRLPNHLTAAADKIQKRKNEKDKTG